MADSSEPVARTERFTIFHTHVERELIGRSCTGRDVFLAFFRTDDTPFPVCTVTLFGNYVEWLETADGWRRRGIAREVIEGLEAVYGELNYAGKTDDGVGFCEAMDETRERVNS